MENKLVEIFALLVLSLPILAFFGYQIYRGYIRRYQQHMTDSLEKNRDKRNVYYEARDEFIRKEGISCLETIVAFFAVVTLLLISGAILCN